MDKYAVLDSKFVESDLFKLTRHRYDVDVPSGCHPIRSVEYSIKKRIIFGFYITIRTFQMDYPTDSENDDDVIKDEKYIKNLAEDAFEALTTEIL